MKYYLSLDFETSDLLQNRGQPVEMGAVLLDKKTLSVLSEFHAFVRFNSRRFNWSVEAELVHNLSSDFLDEEGKDLAGVWSDFLEWLGSWVDLSARGEVMLCGHNLQFDLRFLQVLASVEPLEELLPPWACATTRDTMQWAGLINQATIDGSGFHAAPFKDPETGYPSVSLVNIAKSLGLPFEGAHSALDDARMVGQVMQTVLGNLSEDLTNSRKWEKRLDKIAQRKTEA